MNLQRTFQPARAFTLLEVLIASAIFFTAMFTILELTSRNLNAARNLQPTHADISPLASELFLTNRITDEMLFADGVFGEEFPNHSWSREIVEAGTNGLFLVNFVIYKEGKPESRASIYMYRPQSRLTQRIGGMQ